MLSSSPSETPSCQTAFGPALYPEFPLIALFKFVRPLLTIERLYKYGRLTEYSEVLFSAGQIWFSPPPQLNDPFECRPWFTFEGTEEQIVEKLVRRFRLQNPLMTQDTATEKAKAILLQGRHRDPGTWEALRKYVRENLDREIGLYCMSRVPDSILMWSHYAHDHQGYCLEFEATDHTPVFGETLSVLYRDAYPTVDYFNTPNEEQVNLTYLTKYTGWAYEQEWRIVDFQNGPGLRAYPPELLRAVIFGLRMPDGDKARIKQWVSRRGHAVRFFQAAQHDHKFSIELQAID
jgi:hypothetical protein